METKIKALRHYLRFHKKPSLKVYNVNPETVNGKPGICVSGKTKQDILTFLQESHIDVSLELISFDIIYFTKEDFDDKEFGYWFR